MTPESTRPVDITEPRVSKGGTNPTNTSADRPPPPKGSGGSAHTKIKTMDLRKAAEAARLSAERLRRYYNGDFTAYALEQDGASAFTGDMLRVLAVTEAALQQHDMLAEAVELLRKYSMPCNFVQDFIRRYDAAQQEVPT